MITLLSNIPAGYKPAMVELPEDSNPEYVREDVVTALREVYNERAMFDLGNPKLPTVEALNYTPVPANSDPVQL